MKNQPKESPIPNPPNSLKGENHSFETTISAIGMNVDLVSAFAGDRKITKAEKALIGVRMRRRKSAFFSDLLYTISHHHFTPDVAIRTWNSILSHKREMSRVLGRNVRIIVATLDYLSNIANNQSALTLISEAHLTEITNLSMRDGLTMLCNHSIFFELLDVEFSRRQRYGIDCSLILLDIDDFKLVNDSHGHQEGDRVLVELANVMTQQVRDVDLCCRFGGEEFAVILPFTSALKEACDIAERIRSHAESIRYGEDGITISVGVACCDHETGSPALLFEKADQALYRAKTNGKNCVVSSRASSVRRSRRPQGFRTGENP